MRLLDEVWIECLDLLHLHTQLVTTINYSAIVNLHILQFTLTHTLVFSVFTSRILATDFNTVLIPHVKFSRHRLTFKSQLNSLPSLLNHLHCRLKRLPQLLFQLAWDPRYMSRSGSNRKRRFHRYSSTILLLALPSCCLAMNVYSGSAIPAFRRHVTIYNTYTYLI
jgi:hypothetical protein